MLQKATELLRNADKGLTLVPAGRCARRLPRGRGCAKTDILGVGFSSASAAKDWVRKHKCLKSTNSGRC